MMQKIPILVFFLAVTAGASEYHLNSTATEWQNPESYEETAGTQDLPPKGSEIVIPEGMSISVSSAEDYAFLNTMAGVKPLKGSSLVAHVAEDTTNSLGCAIYVSNNKYDVNAGTLVKEGDGVLELASAGKVIGTWNELCDCNVNIAVNAGRLVPFKGVSAHANFRFFKTVSVAEGAVLELPPGGTCEIWTLDGYGTVTNAGNSVLMSVTSANNRRSRFYGDIGGNIKMTVTGGIYLYSTNNSFNGVAQVSGYKGVPGAVPGFLGVMSFGTETGAGSFGTINYYTFSAGSSSGSAYVEYLGKGENVGKEFGLKSTLKGAFTMDAGAHGGLVFEKPWRNWTDPAEDVAIVLCGSNEVNACSIGSGKFAQAAGKRDNVLKRGSGKWIFTESGTDSNLGSIGVEDGTLSFDSLDNRGYHSALGTSRDLRGASFSGAVASAADLPYAFELGGAEGVPVFEYIGTETAYAYDRPVALKGGVAHLRSSGSGVLKMRGAWMPVEGEATLVLDGANEGENVFSSISNGLGTVSVVKDGSGTWTLSGAQDFSGSLEVKAGKLKLSNKSKYEWYRILFKESFGVVNGEPAKNGIQCKGFALYDAGGNRIGTNLQHVADYRQLQPGQSAYGYTLAVAQSSTTPWRTETTWLTSAAEWYTYELDGETKDDYNGWSVNNPAGNFSLDNPYTYLPVVMRLTNGSPEAVGCDIAQKYFASHAESWARATVVASFELQGSSDGLDWRTLVDVIGCTNTTAADRWAKTDTATWLKQMRKLDDVENDSYYFGGAASPTASSFLSRVKEVKVARGAALEVSEGSVSLPDGVVLAVDCAGEGVASITGLAIPENGTLAVTGTMDGPLELPVVFGGDESYENISGWSVKLNGRKFHGIAGCRNGKVTIRRFGMRLIVR